MTDIARLRTEAVVATLKRVGHQDLAERLTTAAGFPLHLGAEADDAQGDVYRKLVAIKSAMDRFEEIPRELTPLYREVGKAMALAGKARQATTQVREMLKRVRL